MAAVSGRTFKLWFGGIWLAVGLPFLVLGVHVGISEHDLGQRLIREGVYADGMVLAKTISANRRSGRDSDATPNFYVTVRFKTPGGATVKGDAEVPQGRWDSLTERGPIKVRYLPDAPDRFRVDGQASAAWLPFVFAGLGLLFTLVGGAVFVLGLQHVRAVAQLERDGTLTAATVTGVSPARVTINGVPQLVIRYRYQDARGRARSGASDPVPPDEAEAWEAGQQGRVRYDPLVPRRSVWLGRG
jgi:hypothetical protein